MDLTREFAGAERRFRLRLGDILDLEDACGRGLGAIYLRISKHEYSVQDVRHVLRLALRGGGMEAAEAKRLIDARIDAGGFVALHGLAIDVLVNLMADVPPDATGPEGDPETPVDLGKVFAGFAQMGIPPQQVRDIPYKDFVVMVRAMSGDTVQPPSEEEFKAMLARYEETYGG